MILVMWGSLVTTFKRRAIHHHCILSICISSFPHFGFVGRMLALIVLVPGDCFDFTKYISQNGNNISGMTKANSY